MTTFVHWHDLRQGGNDHHDALLAEATQRRQARQFSRRGATPQPDPDESRPLVALRSSPEEALRRRAGFTAREWQRLTFLQWLYRRGHLTD